MDLEDSVDEETLEEQLDEAGTSRIAETESPATADPSDSLGIPGAHDRLKEITITPEAKDTRTGIKKERYKNRTN